MARRWSFRAAASVRKSSPPTSRRFHVITLLRQPWQRPCVPSSICRRPCSNTKQPPLLFPSRLRVRPTLREPPSRRGNQQAASCRGQISGWKARSTFICGHSCPFVSIRGSKSPLRFLRVFASSREAHGLQAPLPAAAISRQPVAEGRSRAGKPELHLIESGDRGH